MAVFAPIPRVRVTSATAANPGVFRNPRIAYVASWAMLIGPAQFYWVLLGSARFYRVRSGPHGSTEFVASGWREMMSRVQKGVRLDRALSKLGLASRTEAKRLIADGRVRVNGRVVRDASVV